MGHWLDGRPRPRCARNDSSQISDFQFDISHLQFRRACPRPLVPRASMAEIKTFQWANDFWDTSLVSPSRTSIGQKSVGLACFPVSKIRVQKSDRQWVSICENRAPVRGDPKKILRYVVVGHHRLPTYRETPKKLGKKLKKTRILLTVTTDAVISGARWERMGYGGISP